MPKTEPAPNLTLFLDVLYTLERIEAPYMIIGGFAATVYGVTRTTYDIDIMVELAEEHIEALTAAYPLPRYYADPEQMRSSIRLGIMFNIIDTTLGQKADLVPLTMDRRYERAFNNRIRQLIFTSENEQLEVWCARPEDVILGKLMAWSEEGSRRHETDIYEIMASHRLESTILDEAYIDSQVQVLGEDALHLWQAIKEALQ